MIDDNEIESIRSSFDQYLKGGQKGLIDRYSRQELEFVLLHEIKLIQKNNNLIPRYMAINKRINELKDAETQRRTTKEKWLDRIIGFVLGVASGYLLHLLAK